MKISIFKKAVCSINLLRTVIYFFKICPKWTIILCEQSGNQIGPTNKQSYLIKSEKTSGFLNLPIGRVNFNKFTFIQSLISGRTFQSQIPTIYF